jgi:hypothetical protein
MPRIARPPLPADFGRVLAHQHGVFSRSQATGCGLSAGAVKAQIEARRWQRLGPRVVVAHNARLDHAQVLWVAVLRCGDGAMLSHQTAAYLHGLVSATPDVVHVTIPARRRIEPPPGVALHRTRSQPAAVGGDFPPHTSVAETVLDIADQCSNASQVVALATRALQRRDLTRASLSAAIEARSRVRWRALLEDLLSVSQAGIESILEWRFGRWVMQAHGLPTPRRQDVAGGGDYDRRDGFFDQYGVVVELDGRLGHVGEGAFRDMRRDNAAVRRGEVVLRYGWADIAGRPCAAALELGSVLKRRGWKGSLRRCSARCRARSS